MSIIIDILHKYIYFSPEYIIKEKHMRTPEKIAELITNDYMERHRKAHALYLQEQSAATRSADLTCVSEWKRNTIGNVQRLIDELQQQIDFTVTFLLPDNDKDYKKFTLCIDVAPGKGGDCPEFEGALEASIYFRFQIRRGLTFEGFVPRISMDFHEGWGIVEVSQREALGLKRRDVTFDIAAASEQIRFKETIKKLKDLEIRNLSKSFSSMHQNSAERHETEARTSCSCTDRLPHP